DRRRLRTASHRRAPHADPPSPAPSPLPVGIRQRDQRFSTRHRNAPCSPSSFSDKLHPPLLTFCAYPTTPGIGARQEDERVYTTQPPCAQTHQIAPVPHRRRYHARGAEPLPSRRCIPDPCRR